MVHSGCEAVTGRTSWCIVGGEAVTVRHSWCIVGVRL